MSGTTAIVFLRAEFVPEMTGRMSHVLGEFANSVDQTRKGRSWNFIADNAVSTLTVLATASHLDEFGELLLDCDLLPDDAPEVCVISIPTSRDCDRLLCDTLTARIALEFDGVCCSVDA